MNVRYSILDARYSVLFFILYFYLIMPILLYKRNEV